MVLHDAPIPCMVIPHVHQVVEAVEMCSRMPQVLPTTPLFASTRPWHMGGGGALHHHFGLGHPGCGQMDSYAGHHLKLVVMHLLPSGASIFVCGPGDHPKGTTRIHTEVNSCTNYNGMPLIWVAVSEAGRGVALFGYAVLFRHSAVESLRLLPLGFL